MDKFQVPVTFIGAGTIEVFAKDWDEATKIASGVIKHSSGSNIDSLKNINVNINIDVDTLEYFREEDEETNKDLLEFLRIVTQKIIDETVNQKIMNGE